MDHKATIIIQNSWFFEIFGRTVPNNWSDIFSRLLCQFRTEGLVGRWLISELTKLRYSESKFIDCSGSARLTIIATPLGLIISWYSSKSSITHDNANSKTNLIQYSGAFNRCLSNIGFFWIGFGSDSDSGCVSMFGQIPICNYYYFR